MSTLTFFRRDIHMSRPGRSHIVFVCRFYCMAITVNDLNAARLLTYVYKLALLFMFSASS